LSADIPGRIEGIMSALPQADDETAAVLTSALARMRTREALAALIQSFTLPNVAARKAVATALGALGTGEALDAVRRAAKSDPDVEVRRICALAATQ
jgi:HEAT repeat protein